MKLWWHKKKHWEYWSVYSVYWPTFLLWLWYALKLRSWRFYAYANPTIANGGLYGDSKADIYALLPKGHYPETYVVKKLADKLETATEVAKRFRFPVVVKPDVGCRGVGVQWVHNFEELWLYGSELEADFLVQEIVDYPNEMGLFYCRMPGETQGTITGITHKVFLTVVGDGVRSLRELLSADARHAMQIPKLSSKMDLDEILKPEESRCLVPFGNHNRGTLFLDGKEWITPELVTTFDNLLRQVDGFYYGRLDIRYNTLDELERGENYAIIELNGAKSEPTHMYDPKHSFWFGQREIWRHQQMLSKIAAANLAKRTSLNLLGLGTAV